VLTEIDGQLERGFARFWKSFSDDDRTNPNINAEEIVEDDRWDRFGKGVWNQMHLSSDLQPKKLEHRLL
jgi:hypothetical protein